MEKSRRIAQALSRLAVDTFVLNALTLRRPFDPLGLGPIRARAACLSTRRNIVLA